MRRVFLRAAGRQPVGQSASHARHASGCAYVSVRARSRRILHCETAKRAERRERGLPSAKYSVPRAEVRAACCMLQPAHPRSAACCGRRCGATARASRPQPTAQPRSVQPRMQQALVSASRGWRALAARGGAVPAADRGRQRGPDRSWGLRRRRRGCGLCARYGGKRWKAQDETQNAGVLASERTDRGVTGDTEHWNLRRRDWSSER